MRIRRNRDSSGTIGIGEDFMKPILILKTGELPRRVTDRLGPYERAFLNLLGDERFVVIDARKEELPEPDWAGVIVTGRIPENVAGNIKLNEYETHPHSQNRRTAATGDRPPRSL